MITHTGTVTLHTDRLTLNQFELEDAPFMFSKYSGDSLVTKYLLFKPHPDLETAERIVAGRVLMYGNDNFYHWAVRCKEDGRLIGAVMAEVTDRHKRAEIGFLFARDEWGKGFAPESAKAVINHLFEKVGVTRIEGLCHIQNRGSERALLKAGFKKEGILYKYMVTPEGNSADYLIFSVTKED